jgi:hypothetical protein
LSSLGLLLPAPLLTEGRLLPEDVEGLEMLLFKGDDLKRCLELPTEADLLWDEEPGISRDDVLLLAGLCGLLLDAFALFRGFEDFSSWFEGALVPVVGKGGKAQSRFVSSGEGCLRGAAIAALLGAFQGSFRPDVALTGEPTEPLPLLAGVNSPAKGAGTG